MDWVPLLDVADVSVADLVASTSPVLARCVDRVVAGLDDPDGIISAFQSYVE
jgi:FXSXX-COOH protein